MNIHVYAYIDMCIYEFYEKIHHTLLSIDLHLRKA